MMDLHQTPYNIHALLKVTGASKSHLRKNLTDYRLKDYYRLSIQKVG